MHKSELFLHPYSVIESSTATTVFVSRNAKRVLLLTFQIDVLRECALQENKRLATKIEYYCTILKKKKVEKMLKMLINFITFII